MDLTGDAGGFVGAVAAAVVVVVFVEMLVVEVDVTVRYTPVCWAN
jgi:hypothetical protein